MRLRFPAALLATLAVCAAGSMPAAAQMSASDVVVRLEQIENQMRMLTGQLEQLQFRNQQLEQQLRRMQEDNEFRFQQLGGASAPRAGTPAQPAAPARPQGQATMPPAADPSAGPSPVRPVAPGRRGDAFDPAANPNAPGAPRTLGALPPGQPSAQPGPIMQEEGAPVETRGARAPGSPLDLSTLAQNPAGAPPQGSAPGPMASLGPAPQSPKDEFEVGYGYLQRKDFATAESSFREFVRRYPNDRLAPDAHFFLGESLFQRQRYQDAAEAFLTVTTKYETVAKAPDALLRLGQSLAALGQKEMSCASFAEIGRKYPRASLSVKQGVEREMKRVRC